MGFRIQRSARQGPLRFNCSSGGPGSISYGGRGFLQHPGEPPWWSPHHRGAARHGPELKRGSLPGSPAAIPAGVTAGLPNSHRLRQGLQDAPRRAQRRINAVQEAALLAAMGGWLT